VRLNLSYKNDELQSEQSRGKDEFRTNREDLVDGASDIKDIVVESVKKHLDDQVLTKAMEMTWKLESCELVVLSSCGQNTRLSHPTPRQGASNFLAHQDLTCITVKPLAQYHNHK
jgi:hypothetical protein